MDEKDKSENTQTAGVIISDNEKGNPYHEGSTGQFTNKDGGDINNKPKKTGLASFFVKLSDKEAQEQKESKKIVDSLMRTPYMDKAKLSELSVEELKKVQTAIIVLEDKDYQITDELEKYDKGGISGLWKTTVYPSDYEKLLKGGNFEAKKKYFEEVYLGSDKDEKLAMLEDLQKRGEKYIEQKKIAEKSYAEYEALVAKYRDNDTYSSARKDNAIWITGSTASVISNSIKKFGKQADDYLGQLKKANPDAYNMALKYTSTYSYINEPLRLVTYQGGGAVAEEKQKSFVKDVGLLTTAIDGSTYDEDVWLQRGVSDLTIDNVRGGGESLSSFVGYKEDLSNLVGMQFKDHGFVSAGAGSGTGFTGRPVNLFIYAPKGTKMLYMNTQGAFSHTKENEMIIQRGYTYTITNAYKKGGSICCDCEVVLGTDGDKYDADRLNYLSTHYFNLH